MDGVRFKLRGNTGLQRGQGCYAKQCAKIAIRELFVMPIVLLCCVLFKFPKGPCAQTLYTLAPSTNTGIALRLKYILFGRMDHADPKPQTPKLLKPSTLNIFGAASSTARCSEDRASLVLFLLIKGSGCAATSPYSP